ncbi:MULTISPECIES: hypothetical protein [unclassified Streptomyces]|uniref:hypothetical protein n=1 Tax=unclassified Streptomyces TaxID=2593676 RepID=UPI002E75D351|nr:MULTISPECIES: hypothetical protein [unclassified Streptomyces]MEE1759753.1 hypothetical protein [Streptomyces sp. SP18BB07]MEE1829497.1 hypothetical protein [Streptomyces sp. SP17KL33]
MAGLAVALLVYAGLLATSVREEESLVEAGWTSSAAERLRPYGTVAAETGTALVHDAAQVLTWILAFAPLPLAVLSLLWLARRDQGVYMRLAVALLLSGTAGLGVFALVRGAREASLFGDYLALPGARVGWYVLMALAVVATTSKTWPRAAVLLIAVLAAVTGASTGGDLWLAALPAMVVPLLAWYAAGHLPYEKERHARGGADASPAGESRGRVLSFRPRTRVPQPTDTPAPAPLREAG